MGANYGDEGKGLVTNIFANERGTINIRHNGGAQAGHTVVHKKYGRHVFHHLGSGTFNGTSTYLTGQFICNPILFKQEHEIVSKMMASKNLTVLVNKNCMITTPYDMILNQQYERKVRHGSCGVGIWETAVRSMDGGPGASVEAFYATNIGDTLLAIRDDYGPKRAEYLDIKLPEYWYSDLMFELAIEAFQYFGHYGIHATDENIKGHNLVFEGAQGLLLDEEYGDSPHITYGNCGLKNPMAICQALGIGEICATYVTRSYLTRHGEGPIRGNTERVMAHFDDTNTHNEWQGSLRFADLDKTLAQRIKNDLNHYGNGVVRRRLCITHMDQYGFDRVPVLEMLDYTIREIGDTEVFVSSDPTNLQPIYKEYFGEVARTKKAEEERCLV